MWIQAHPHQPPRDLAAPLTLSLMQVRSTLDIAIQRNADFVAF